VFNYHFRLGNSSPSGQYFEWILSGVKVTLQLSVVSVALSFILGLLIAVHAG